MPSAAQPDQRLRGYLFVLIGVFMVTPDAVCVRIAVSYGGTFWWIISMKCFFLGFMLLAFVLVHHSWSKLAEGLRSGPRHLALVAFWQGLVTIGFPVCFQTTTSAKALLLISLNPLWAALLGWRVLGDVVPRRTVITLVGAGLSVLFILLPPILGDTSEDDGASNTTSTATISADGVGNWRGDLLSVGTGLSLASLITSSRYAAMRRPRAPGAIAMALGSFGAAAVTFVAALVVEPHPSFEPPFWGLMVADAAGVAGCTVLALTLAVRYISPAEVALVLLLENVMGPLWVAIAGFEVPDEWTLGGGALLVLVLGAHQAAAVHEGRRLRRDQAAKERLSTAGVGAAQEAEEKTVPAEVGVCLAVGHGAREGQV